MISSIFPFHAESPRNFCQNFIFHYCNGEEMQLSTIRFINNLECNRGNLCIWIEAPRYSPCHQSSSCSPCSARVHEQWSEYSEFIVMTNITGHSYNISDILKILLQWQTYIIHVKIMQNTVKNSIFLNRQIKNKEMK